MPRSPKKPTTFFTTWSKPGTERSVCSAARSAGCSHVTGAIWVRILRGRAAGRVDSVIWMLLTGTGIDPHYDSSPSSSFGHQRARSPGGRQRLFQVGDQVFDLLDSH